MKDGFVISDERVLKSKHTRLIILNIPKLTDEFISHCTVRFPNVSPERLNGIRALLDRTGIEKVTPNNLGLAKQR